MGRRKKSSRPSSTIGRGEKLEEPDFLPPKIVVTEPQLVMPSDTNFCPDLPALVSKESPVSQPAAKDDLPRVRARASGESVREGQADAPQFETKYVPEVISTDTPCTWWRSLLRTPIFPGTGHKDALCEGDDSDQASVSTCTFVLPAGFGCRSIDRLRGFVRLVWSVRESSGRYVFQVRACHGGVCVMRVRNSNGYR